MSAANPSATTSQPTPLTPFSGPQATTYASVVQGRKISPRSGQTHVSNATSTLFPKTHQMKSATRGPRNPAVRARQHTGRQPSRTSAPASSPIRLVAFAPEDPHETPALRLSRLALGLSLLAPIRAHLVLLHLRIRVRVLHELRAALPAEDNAHHQDREADVEGRGDQLLSQRVRGGGGVVRVRAQGVGVE